MEILRFSQKLYYYLFCAMINLKFLLLLQFTLRAEKIFQQVEKI